MISKSDRRFVHVQVVSHKHLRQRIEAFRVAGGVLPAESGASAADPAPLCGSEVSYQVLTQGVARSERTESHTQFDSPRAESIATSVGRHNPLRRKVRPPTVRHCARRLDRMRGVCVCACLHSGGDTWHRRAVQTTPCVSHGSAGQADPRVVLL